MKRRYKKVTQDDVAEWLGISPGHLSNLLNRNKIPGGKLLASLKTKTGISADNWLELPVNKLKIKVFKSYTNSLKKNETSRRD